MSWWLVPAAFVVGWIIWAALDMFAGTTTAPSSSSVGAATAVFPKTLPPNPPNPPAPFSPEGEQVLHARRALWLARLELAQSTLDDYRRSTRYPTSSQPLALHSDQAYPNLPIEEELALSAPGMKDKLTLRTSQERVFVQGDESVRFTVSVRDSDGAAQPLRIVRASARELAPPNTGSLYPVIPLNFNDEGSGGDSAAGDGTFSARLQPKSDGYDGLFGQIRVEAVLQYRDQQGQTYFDIMYTPEPPAVWQGGVREALEDGSLNFYLKATVKEAGRYVVRARVDDASGAPLALLAFNEEVPQGTQEFRMTLFGKLVRDAKPAFPLVVRDVDAFLLRADAFPDRRLMPRLPGRVHTSQDYQLASFAEAEWTSEERTRYLLELGRDVAIAQEQVNKLTKPP